MIERREFLRAAGAAATAATLAGCRDGGDAESESLAIEHVRTVASRPSGYRQYEEVADATYDRETVVWLYFEPVGVAAESVGDGRRIDLATSLSVTMPDGAATVLEDTVERTVGEGESLETLFLFWQFDATDPALPGEYEAEISVTDALADGETATVSTAFVLESADVEDPFVAAMRLDVREHLSVTLRSVERTDGAMRVEYDSTHSIDSEPSGQEVGYIIGRYTTFVANGLETDELVGTVHAADGTYRYRLSSERARAWAAGEVTTDEVVTGIYRNIEQV